MPYPMSPLRHRAVITARARAGAVMRWIWRSSNATIDEIDLSGYAGAEHGASG